MRNLFSSEITTIFIYFQGSTQISMAEFSNQDGHCKWYNIISRQIESESDHPESLTLSVTKEESSDESTIISSQTSTLTRNQGNILNNEV